MKAILFCLFFLCGYSICLYDQFPIMKLTPKSSTSENFLTTNICIGTPGDQCFDLRLDFSSFYITVVNKTEKNKEKSYQTFNTSLSSSFVLNKNDNIPLSNQVTGTSASDRITIDKSDPIDEMTIVLTDGIVNPGAQSDGVLGLGYRSTASEEEYSFLNQLYLKKIISHKIFYIDFTSNSFWPQLFIGDLPNVAYKDYQHYGYCDLMQKKINSQEYNKNWECLVKNVHFPLTNINITEGIPISFALNSTNLVLPLKLKNAIVGEYFNLTSNKMCYLQERQGENSVLYCRLSAKIPSIFLEFEKWRLEIPSSLLMAGGFGTFFKIATFSPKINKIILGQKILQNLTIVYDRENDQVGFYSPNYLTYIGEEELKKPKFGSRPEPSILSRPGHRETVKENKFEEIKGKINGTLWMFGLLCLATLAIVGVLFFFGNTKEEEKKIEVDDSIEPIYTNNDNELIDMDLNSSKASSTSKYAINH